MAALPITRDDILRHSNSKSFARGEEYYESGAVLDVTRRGNTVTAEVEGSYEDSYMVTVNFESNGDIDADCDCPYDYDGWCKHIVAVMLACLHDTEEIEELPPLEVLLDPLNRAALQTLVLKLVEKNPRLVDDISDTIEKITACSLKAVATLESPNGQLALPPINPQAIRRKTKNALRKVNYSEYDYYGEEGADTEEMEEDILALIEEAGTRTQSGDTRGALQILEALTDELLDGASRIEEIAGEYSYDLCEDLGLAWVETLLTQEHTDEERRTWKTRLQEWKRKRTSAGLGDAIGAALLAVEQGWDYPPLVRVLQGEITDKGAWEGEPPDGADLLATARLNILERQERWQEAIYLAEAEGQTERFIALLVKTGRTEEAVEQARTLFTHPDQILQLAHILDEQGETEKALQLAEHGLTIEPPKPMYAGMYVPYGGGNKPLADWLREAAYKHGNTALAIQAAMVGMKESPTLTDYKRLKEISGAEWEALREPILDDVSKRKGYGNAGPVDILLHEARNHEALQVVSEGGDSHLLMRVVEAAMKTHPAEVIAPCRKQAERIMDGGQSAAYDEAARWMKQIREAYRALGQMDEWQNYKERTIEKHKKKYKLVPLLLPL